MHAHRKGLPQSARSHPHATEVLDEGLVAERGLRIARVRETDGDDVGFRAGGRDEAARMTMGQMAEHGAMSGHGGMDHQHDHP